MRVNLTRQEVAICLILVIEHMYDKHIDTHACFRLKDKLERARKEN